MKEQRRHRQCPSNCTHFFLHLRHPLYSEFPWQAPLICDFNCIRAYCFVCGLFWFVLFKKQPWQHCAYFLFQSHQSRQQASPMFCTRKWIGKKTRNGDFDVPQSVMCHQQPSLWLSVMMCLKELLGCRLIDHLKAPQARELRRDDPQSRKKTV